MRLIGLLFLGFLLPLLASAAQVYGVFTNIASIAHTPLSTQYTKGVPGNPTWNAVLNWKIPQGTYFPGDTFKLSLPCVGRFLSTTSTVSLSASGINYATCKFANGLITVTYSELQCTILNTVTPSLVALGTITVPFIFNMGLGGTTTDYTCASFYQAGANTISWSDGQNTISTSVNFVAGFPINTMNLATGQFSLRNIVDIKRYQDTMMASLNCLSVGWKTITYGIRVTGTTTIDCSNVHVGITNDVNAWYKPISAKSFPITGTCTPQEYVVTMTDVPAGYWPIMDVLHSYGSSGNLVVTYVNQGTCANSDTPYNKQLVNSYSVVPSTDPSSEGVSYYYTTITYSGSTTLVSTRSPSGSTSQTITIEVNVPTPTVTYTLTYTGSVITTVTLTATVGGTATVIVEVPTPTTTVTTTYTGSVTTTLTQTASAGGTNTVVVEVPTPVTTVTSTWTGIGTTTVTQTATAGGTNTVIVEVPTPASTLTSTWTGTETTTVTRTATAGGTNTIIVEVPTPTTTVTSTYTGTGTTSLTKTASAGGTNTIIVEVPTPVTTVTSTWTGTETTTVTQTASEGGTNTVIVEVPTPVTTLTSTWTGTETATVTQTASEGGTITVIVEVPTPVTTLTSTWTGTFTTTVTQTASEGGTDTVIVEVPSPTNPITTITSTWTGTETTTVTPTASAGGTDTVIVEVPTPVVVSSSKFSLGIYWNSSSSFSVYTGPSSSPIVSSSVSILSSSELPVSPSHDSSHSIASLSSNIISTNSQSLSENSSTNNPSLSEKSESTPRTSGDLSSSAPSPPVSTGPSVSVSTNPGDSTSTGPSAPASTGPGVSSTGPSVPVSTGPIVSTSTGPSVPASTGPSVSTSTGPSVPASTGPSAPTGPSIPTSTGPSTNVESSSGTSRGSVSDGSSASKTHHNPGNKPTSEDSSSTDDDHGNKTSDISATMPMPTASGSSGGFPSSHPTTASDGEEPPSHTDHNVPDGSPSINSEGATDVPSKSDKSNIGAVLTGAASASTSTNGDDHASSIPTGGAGLLPNGGTQDDFETFPPTLVSTPPIPGVTTLTPDVASRTAAPTAVTVPQANSAMVRSRPVWAFVFTCLFYFV